jgi:ElaB/YqjD/DUF883 family membrane-anchored ribosome-binding protein
MAHVNTDKLIEDLRVVIHDAEELLRATAGQAGEHIAEARAKAEASLHSARALLASLTDAIPERAREAAARAGNYVEKNPWVAVGAGAVVGLLLGLLLSNRSGQRD